MRYELRSLVLINTCLYMCPKYLISYIFYLIELGRKASRIQVKNILYNYLLFNFYKLLRFQAYFQSKRSSFSIISKSSIINIIRGSYSLIATKLTSLIRIKRKLNPPFLILRYYLRLERYYIKKLVFYLLRLFRSLTNIGRSLIEYITYIIEIKVSKELIRVIKNLSYFNYIKSLELRYTKRKPLQSSILLIDKLKYIKN